ncbi:MAG: hypothetical protein NVS1B4_25030 [Gemmatimonadaceae bacterium]
MHTRRMAGLWSIAGLTGIIVGGCVQPVVLAPRPNAIVNGNSAVAVGYATQPARNLVVAVGSVELPQDQAAHYTRVEEMLLGRVAGLEVLRRADGAYSLRLRGNSSILGGTEPLLVMDGMPINLAASDALAGLSPRDVVRIDVLKDAGATAIFGSRGANGVVVITTRRTR